MNNYKKFGVKEKTAKPGDLLMKAKSCGYKPIKKKSPIKAHEAKETASYEAKEEKEAKETKDKKKMKSDKTSVSMAMKMKVKTPAKVAKVMNEFSKGVLHSGSKKGPKVTNPKQAVAIGYSEAKKARQTKKKVNR